MLAVRLTVCLFVFLFFLLLFFFFQAEDGIRDIGVTGVQTCALPIYNPNYFIIVRLFLGLCEWRRRARVLV